MRHCIGDVEDLCLDVEIEVKEVRFLVLVLVVAKKIKLHASVQLVLLLNVVAVLDVVLTQVADGIDGQVDPSGQPSDRFEHLLADILDDHVAEEDVDAGPDDNYWQPYLKHSVKE